MRLAMNYSFFHKVKETKESSKIKKKIRKSYDDLPPLVKLVIVTSFWTIGIMLGGSLMLGALGVSLIVALGPFITFSYFNQIFGALVGVLITILLLVAYYVVYRLYRNCKSSISKHYHNFQDKMSDITDKF